MAAGRNYPLSLILSAIDKASGPVQKIHANLLRLTAPQRAVSNQFSALTKETKALGETAGIPRLVSGFHNVSAAITGVERAAQTSFRRVGVLVAGGAGLAYLFKRQFIDTASTFENLEVSLEAIEGDAGKARRAMTFIKDLTFKTPFELEDIARSFRVLRGFGLDPIANNTLPAIADQVAKLGLKGEDLSGIALQLGQAFSKGRLQAQDANILVERGVPVWGLLQRAVERVNNGQKVTVAQLRQMSEDGQLGQSAIRELIRQMEIESQGASARMMGTWSGMISNLSDHWTFFKLQIKESGAFNELKSNLRGILSEIDRMSRDGRLQQWANRIGEALKVGFIWLRTEGPAIVRGIVGGVQSIWRIANSVAEAFGGWENLIKVGVAAYIAGPMVKAVGSLAFAIGGLNLALAGTPAGLLLLAGAGVVAGAGYLLTTRGPFEKSLMPSVPQQGRRIPQLGDIALGSPVLSGNESASGLMLSADQAALLRQTLAESGARGGQPTRVQLDINAPKGTGVRVSGNSDVLVDVNRGFSMSEAGAR